MLHFTEVFKVNFHQSLTMCFSLGVSSRLLVRKILSCGCMVKSASVNTLFYRSQIVIYIEFSLLISCWWERIFACWYFSKIELFLCTFLEVLKVIVNLTIFSIKGNYNQSFSFFLCNCCLLKAKEAFLKMQTINSKKV